jgi:hypothetical protein
MQITIRLKAEEFSALLRWGFFITLSSLKISLLLHPAITFSTSRIGKGVF